MAALVLAAISCTDSFESGTGNPVPSCVQKKIIHASDNAGRGRLIVRFGDEALACLEQNIPTRSGEPLTRSGIGTVDSVLDELGVCSLERVFPLVPSLSRRRARPGCTAGTLSISVMTLIWMRLRSVCRHWGRSRSGALPQMTPSRGNLCSFCHIFKELTGFVKDLFQNSHLMRHLPHSPFPVKEISPSQENGKRITGELLYLCPSMTRCLYNSTISEFLESIAR